MKLQNNATGPRIFNQTTEAEQIALLQKKANKRRKEIHRVRRNRIVAIFAVVFVVMGAQILSVTTKTNSINNQVSASKVELKKAEATNETLKTQVKQLQDESYVGKLIRYKYYYSKPGETVYNLPQHEFELSVNDEK